MLDNVIAFALYILAIDSFGRIALIIDVHPFRAGADRIDDHSGALRHLDGRAARTSAAVVIAIGNDDQHAANIGIRAGWQRRISQQLLTGAVNRVVQGGAASGALLQDRIAQVAAITGELLDDLWAVVEGHQQGLVPPATYYLKYNI